MSSEYGHDRNYERLVINDVLYGNVSFPPLIKCIVDTEQFQRLRDIKQLGVTNFVYPSAVHSRFEHSIGTAYMCSTFLKILKEQLNLSYYGTDLVKKFSEDLITDKEIMCVQLAGLLHDIGHGPFSHFFEKLDNTGCWSHEEMSCKMIDYLIESNPQVQHQMRLADLNQDDINLVKNLILGATPFKYHHPDCDFVGDINNNNNNNNNKSLKFTNNIQSSISSPITNNEFYLNSSIIDNEEQEQIDLSIIDNDNIIPYITPRDDPTIKIKKWFLFQIVSNKINGIDCDKFDYMLRDCYYVGVKCNFDYMRYFQNCQLLQTTIDGIYISPRDKEFFNINELFYSRWKLHRRVYRHKTVKATELMLHEALKLSDDYFQLSLSLKNPKLFNKLTDHIYYQILYSNDPALANPKHILTCITKRKILKLCGQVTLPDDFSFDIYTSNSCNDHILKEILKYDSTNLLNPKYIHIDILDISSGMHIDNPIDTIVFHTKNEKFAKLRPQYISNMIPKVFSDKILRVFFGSLYDGYDPVTMGNYFQHAVMCFQDWCNSMGLPLPHTISIKDTSGYFTHIPFDKSSDFYKRKSDMIACKQYTVTEADKNVTKMLKFNNSPM